MFELEDVGPVQHVDSFGVATNTLARCANDGIEVSVRLSATHE